MPGFLIGLVLFWVSSLFAQTQPSTLTPAQVDEATANTAISKNPKSADRYNDLAHALIERARETSDPKFYDQADAAVAQSLHITPDNFTGQKLHVAVLIGKCQYTAAIELAKALNKRVPDDVPVYGLVADAAMELGDYKLAEDRAQWMLNLRPPSTLSLMPAVRLRVLFGDYNGAFDFLNQAYRMTGSRDNVQRAEILVESARLSLSTGKLDEADKVLQQALISSPDYHPALVTLARVRSAQQRHDEAIELWRHECQSLPQLENYYGLAESLDLAGRRDEAASAFKVFEQKALARTNSPANDNRELVFYYADHAHKPAEALRIAQIESARRHDVHTLDAYAWALYSNGDNAEARKQMDSALAVGIRDSDMLYHAGAIRLELHEQPAAVSFWQQSLSVNPLCQPARKALAQAGALAQVPDR